MTLCTVAGIKIKIDFLLLILIFLWLISGFAETAFVIFLALLLHELAHIFMAALLNVKTYEIRLLPFGCSAHMDDIFETHPFHETLIALAGPVVSVVCAMACITMDRYYPALLGTAGKTFTDYSFLITGFNLLPALPLDGGRVLRACISRSNDRGRATKITAILGIVLGAGMVSYGIYTFIMHKGDAVLPMLGVFLVLSAADEIKQSKFQLAKALVNRSRRHEQDESMGVKILAVREDMEIEKAVRLFKDNNYYVLRILDNDLNLIGSVDESMVQNSYMSGKLKLPVGKLLNN
jgi:stage IV sporulation protein FB